jgi:hypothetical protein
MTLVSLSFIRRHPDSSDRIVLLRETTYVAIGYRFVPRPLGGLKIGLAPLRGWQRRSRLGWRGAVTSEVC